MLRGILLHNGIVERFQCCVGGRLGHPPSGYPHSPPLHTTMFPCIALVMPFSRDTLTELNMTLVRLSGAKSLRDPLVSQLLGEWVASSPLARARWSEAMVVGHPSLIRTKQPQLVKQYASHLFPAPDLIGLLMDLSVPKVGFRHMMEYMSRRGSAYSAATALPLPCPIPTREAFTDAWKEVVTPLDLRPPVSVPDPPASGGSWPLPSWARYVQSRPSLVDTIDWTRPLTFIVRGHAYPCAGGSWTQLSIGILNHGARGRTSAYLWVIGMAVCGDKDMAALATIWADNLKVWGPFVVCEFLHQFLEINI